LADWFLKIDGEIDQLKNRKPMRFKISGLTAGSDTQKKKKLEETAGDRPTWEKPMMHFKSSGFETVSH
jgi:hypothetical protein